MPLESKFEQLRYFKKPFKVIILNLSKGLEQLFPYKYQTNDDYAKNINCELVLVKISSRPVKVSINSIAAESNDPQRKTTNHYCAVYFKYDGERMYDEWTFLGFRIFESG